MTAKLNSMRLLDSRDIPYEVVRFDANIHDAAQLAEAVGVPYHMVYKTLVVDTAAKKPLLALIPADKQLNLKALAKLAGYKKLSMAAHAQAEAWTGLQTGGISPLLLQGKGWPLYLDSAATRLQHVMLSAGQRGVNLRVPTADLMALLNPTLGDIAA
ncbi:MAG: YbaK/EbsC family protein [Anaerolineales bacterium]